MEAKCILITGGAGFIGSTLANHLSKENSVIVIDDLSMGKEENLLESENLRFINGSVTDNKSVSYTHLTLPTKA